ncbi:unnamed protein product, partial [Mesorhabditis belari]|uniref:CHK kinase-like domain-containing protein n=1 Tax=Mesorhabditis belari TaxID=2138241 RepID=A0AAF3J547_9BILA
MVAENMRDNETIIDTVITWGMVEGDLQKQFKTKARTGPARSAKLLSGGYVSKSALITFDWSDEQERLPKRGMIKITSSAGMKALSELNGAFLRYDEMATCFSDTEYNFYKNAPQVGILDEIPVPNFIGGRPFGVDGVEAGYTILEFLENVHNRHVFHALSPKTATEAVKMLARIAAYSLRHRKEARILAENEVFEDFFSDFTRDQRIQEGFEAIESRWPDLKPAIDVMRTKSKVFTSAKNFKNELVKACKHETIVHGDMWPGNILFNKSNAGDYSIRVIVDWQTMHIGNPMEDLTRLLSTGLGADEYRNRRDFYLETYYETLKAETKGEELPWDSLEKLIEDYEKAYPLIAIVWIPPFILVLADDHIREHSDGEDDDVRLKTFLDKYRLMIEESAKYIKKWKL